MSISMSMWDRIRREAHEIVASEPALASYVYASVLSHDSLEHVVIHRVAQGVDHPEVRADLVRRTFEQALAAEPALREMFEADLAAVFERDPASGRVIQALLYFKGFAAIQTHRLAHWLWNQGRRDFASYLQSRSSAVFGVDLHPAARIGRGLMFDHATGIVIGETAVIDDDVSILQGVTLGGTGKEHGDRHPKIRAGVMIGAGATILGNIEIGAGARVAAGSVVLRPVPAGKTVAGIPSKIVGDADDPAHTMDQVFDPII
ncbi:MAG: serine O-acetyltransferase [Kofleriaceae bacterium]|nr:serine O-acetyltransferase [Kofleriaceae bacterium]MCL4225497.1 serine O-acetyltransferase [Myxococcales bacterium]